MNLNPLDATTHLGAAFLWFGWLCALCAVAGLIGAAIHEGDVKPMPAPPEPAPDPLSVWRQCQHTDPTPCTQESRHQTHGWRECDEHFVERLWRDRPTNEWSA